MTKKHILLTCCTLFIGICVNAQSIKEQLRQKQQKQRYEREQRESEIQEQARIKKAQLSLNDLLQLLQSKDLDYVDKFLTNKGWKLYSTNINEKKEYNDKTSTDYEEVTWTFDKNPDDDLAKGWFNFYRYPTSDNAVAYAIADDIQFERLKLELINNDYKRIYPTDAIERGLESVYRNNLYEVNFIKRVKKKYEGGADISYTFYIYNYKQVEERRAEAERIAREAAELEEKYKNAIKQAERSYRLKLYSFAKQEYEEALTFKPENREKFLDILADIDINILCEDAERLFKSSQYEEAKIKYAEALTIKPNMKISYINEKINAITDFQQFLEERVYKQYDYKNLEPADYNIKDNYIEGELKRSLLANAENLPRTSIYIVCEIDTFGNVVSNYTVSIQNKNLNALLDIIIRNIMLKPCYLNGYTAMAKAEFTYTLLHNHSVISVNNRPQGLTSKHKDFDNYRPRIRAELGSNAPYGKYTFDVNKTIINGQVFYNNRLLKMRSSGGASNALLSLFVPGLGDHRVSYGKKKGVGVALSTYALIGTGIGLKFYSISEYKKYNNAADQSTMGDHYIRAYYSDKVSYYCIISGSIIWISDIIWVASTGAKNNRVAKAYRKSYLSMYYDPYSKATGLSYTISF